MIRFTCALAVGWFLVQPVLACEAVAVDDAVCNQVNVLGAGPQVVCHWKFKFRSQAATDQFERVGAALLACFGAAKPAEVGVNHPDSYDQRVFMTDAGDVSVALKDKGGLAETYVFLRGPAGIVAVP